LVIDLQLASFIVKQMIGFKTHTRQSLRIIYLSLAVLCPVSPTYPQHPFSGETQADSLLHIANSYFKNEEYREAAILYHRYHILRDSLQQVAVNLDPLPDSLRASREMQTTEQFFGSVALNDQRWQMFTVISLSVLFILVLGRYINAENKRKRTLMSQLGRLESTALKAQMNPHFIFNSLNSIQSLIANDHQSDAMLYVSKFSKLLRSVMENSSKNLITLQNELQNLKFYIELEFLRLNFNLNYSIDVDPAISADSEWVPPLIIQPIVENSLWHGLNGKDGARELKIRVEAEGKFLKFAISDNGIGRQAARNVQTKSSTGIGLSATERRISLFNENSGSDNLWIEDVTDPGGEPLGTKVIFKVRRVV
jgi:two-component sensor histidine kinase